jgi:exosortase/archaeosortase family protein
MKKKGASVFDIILRYLILILIGFLGTGIFYLLFSAITIYPVYFFLNFFFDTSLKYNIITINNSPIEIIGACIAGSAYFLLLILNLSTREIKIKKRLFLLLFSFSSLLVVNILRIFLLSILFVLGTSFFDITHKLFWYAGSTIFVVAIWFLGVSIFKVKKIPFYADIVFLLNSRKKIKNSKSSKKH